MSLGNKLNPNILLTEVCNLSCPFCFAKERIGAAQKREMDLRDFRELLDFLEKNNQSEVRLMGGEPTLHSQFEEIVNHSLSRGFKIRLFTNGFFSENLASWMAEKKQSITYSINLSAVAFSTEKKKSVMENNLKILSSVSKINGSLTVDYADFSKYNPLIELLKKNKFDSIRISVANNTVKNSSSNSVAEDYRNIISTAIRLVDEVKRTSGNSSVSFNCGFTPCMFEESSMKHLLGKHVKFRGWGCKGKIGSFDISSDLETFPCYEADNLKNDRVCEFKSLEYARRYNNDLFEYALQNSSLSTINKCKSCGFFKERKCEGPCLGYVRNNKMDKVKFDNFKNKIQFKVVKKILWVIRNW